MENYKWKHVTLTGENCGHQSCKHEEQHGEEQKARVAENFLGLVSNSHVQKTNQYSNPKMRDYA